MLAYSHNVKGGRDMLAYTMAHAALRDNKMLQATHSGLLHHSVRLHGSIACTVQAWRVPSTAVRTSCSQHLHLCCCVACRCVSGCTCDESEINGYHIDHNSLLKLHRVYVSQHAECVMAVQVRGGLWQVHSGTLACSECVCHRTDKFLLLQKRPCLQ